jgi:hypothetical protein
MGMVQIVTFFPIEPDECGYCTSKVCCHLMGVTNRFAPPQAWDTVDVGSNDFFMPWQSSETHGDNVYIVSEAHEILREAVDYFAAPASQWREFIA